MDFDKFMSWIVEKNPAQEEFHQAVEEVAKSVVPYINENPVYEKWKILERMSQPDRFIHFKVVWADDDGNVHLNRGYRVQFNQAIGPYKGGLRFDPSVNSGILKFLGFEQIFKNSLTTLPIGAGKGGADFNPKGRSDAEVMRFCYSYMAELFRHIGEHTDVPAGDIGVGAREIGYLYGMHRKLTNRFTGTITGRGIEYGGSLVRTEATGYGAVYFTRDALKHINESIEGKVAVVSGSGNVAQYASQKLIQLGAKVLTLSDRGGYIYVKDGISLELLDEIIYHKSKVRGTLEEFANKKGIDFVKDKRPWEVKCDMAFPCATQNEISIDDAMMLVENGCKVVTEGANMPSTKEATEYFVKNSVIFLPAKAANAGGVAVSALEMSQAFVGFYRSFEEVDEMLQQIMNKIHTNCLKYGLKDGKVDYINGANIAGFVKVANAMVAGGIA